MGARRRKPRSARVPDERHGEPGTGPCPCPGTGLAARGTARSSTVSPRRRPTPIEQASQWAADTIAAGGLVHLFGTGHSRIPVEEMFPRYGSYPGFNPMVELSMTFHTQVVGSNGQRQAMAIERMPGLAEQSSSPTSTSSRTTCS